MKAAVKKKRSNNKGEYALEIMSCRMRLGSHQEEGGAIENKISKADEAAGREKSIGGGRT
jgi:hypothetical protein